MRLNVELLRELKEEQQLTMDALKKATGVGLRTLSKVFSSGDASLNTARAIAVAFKRSLAEIEESGDTGTAYTAEQLRERLLSGSYGRAHCCAYLAGDFSVLTVKRAFVVPVDAYVHVGVRESARTVVELFTPEGDDWVESPRGDDIEQGLRKHLVDPLLRRHFDWCPTSLHVTVVAEVPTGFGLHEECALALALAAAIRKHVGRGDDPDGIETLLFAGALLSVRYIDISWATLVGSQQAADRFKVLSFDRNNDGGIDLPKLYRREANGDDLARNVYPSRPFWNVTPQQFDLNALSFWWSPKLRDDKDAHPISLERLRLPMQYVFDQINLTFENGGTDFYNRFGVLMQLHQLLLASANAVRPDVQRLLTRINGFRGVLGTKLACGRHSGAFVLLTDHGFDQKKFQQHMKPHELEPLDGFRLPLEIEG